VGKGDPVDTDCILLEGLTFYGYHGVKEAEAELGQPFVVDLALWLPLRAAGMSDDLGLTVDYSDVYRTAQAVVEGDRCRLLEAVAERLAAAILGRYPVYAVRVRLNKPQAPLRGAVFSRVGVEITRVRQGENE
jgi:7,8-dihydroneopterin aldolase/epimerase/oxygenase